MRNLVLVVKEDLKNLCKNPMWVFYVTAFPLLMVIILGYLTKDSYGSIVTSFDYYGITLMLYTVLNSGMTSTNAFMEERIKKPNMRIIYASKNESILFLSKIISSFLFCFAFHILDMFIICLAFHVRIREIGLLLVVMAALELCSVTIGIMLCCILKSEIAANQVLSIIINLMAILGGLLFSLDGYGKALQIITRISPIKWVSDLVFEVIYDGNTKLFVPCMLGMGLAMVVMVGICKLTFNKEDCIC